MARTDRKMDRVRRVTARVLAANTPLLTQTLTKCSSTSRRSRSNLQQHCAETEQPTSKDDDHADIRQPTKQRDCKHAEYGGVDAPPLCLGTVRPEFRQRPGTEADTDAHVALHRGFDAHVAERCEVPFGLATSPHPVRLLDIAINLFWHAKVNRDPALQLKEMPVTRPS